MVLLIVISSYVFYSMCSHYWIFTTGYSLLDIHYWIFTTGYSLLDIHYWIFVV